MYAARHPDHVRSLVLDGAYPLRFDPWARDRIAAFRDAIRLVCRRTHRCDGNAALSDLAAVARRLGRRPLPITLSGAGGSTTIDLGEPQLAWIAFAAHGEPAI
jgi:pimeloyl-ACP methyl ester carboxylesterase